MAIKIINPVVSEAVGEPNLQEKTITENGEYVADEGYDGLSKVKVNVESGASFNIHYGLNPPEDTSMLWVETDTVPNNIMLGVHEAKEQKVDRLDVIPSYYQQLYGGGSAVLGTKLYIFGGMNFATGSSSATNNATCFDMESETLTTIAKLPQEVEANPCATVGDKIYIFGGFGKLGASTSLRVYDPETDTYSTPAASLPMTTYPCSVIATKAYFFNNYGTYVFDTETGTYTTINAKMPVQDELASSCAYGKYIYLFPGVYQNFKTEKYGQRFDTEENTFTTFDASALTSTLQHHGIVIMGSKAYVIEAGSNLQACLLFDFETETFTRLDIGWRYAVGNARMVGSLGTKIYVAYMNKVGSTVYYIQRFETCHEQLPKNVAYLKASLTDNVLQLVGGENSVNIGVESVHLYDTDGGVEQANAYLYDESTASWELI
jgi:N-acetylneuraminic acid mutarotase